MFIQTEETPNPSTLKFLPGQTVLSQGTIDFPTKPSAASSPLASGLFEINGVTRIFLADEFITVTKSDEQTWDVLKPQVISFIMDYFSHSDHTAHATNDEEIPENEDDISKQIRELIATKVQPAVAQDGGNIIFKRFEDGIVYVEMQGSCSGCPSSTATLKSGIENMLRYYVPEVEEIRATNA